MHYRWICWLFFMSAPVCAKNWQTYWGTKKPDPVDPLKMDLGSQVPEKPEKFIWVTQQLQNSTEPQTDQIPVYMREPSSPVVQYVGEVPVGTEVVFDGFIVRHHQNHFKIPTPSSFVPTPNSKVGTLEHVWVPGRFLKAVRLAEQKSE